MINEDTLKYQRMAIMSVFSESTQKHLHNISNEMKEILRDEVIDFLKTERGQSVIKGIMNSFIYDCESSAEAEKSTEETRNESNIQNESTTKKVTKTKKVTIG